MVIGPHLAAARRAQRGDRDRPGVVRVVLFVPRPPAADPCGELGLHVQDPLPAATSCWATRWPRPAAPSTAQVRSGHAAAHSTSCSACPAAARTRSAQLPLSPLTATAVCEPLCGSTPIITAVTELPSHALRTKETTAAGMPYYGPLGVLAPLSNHATARIRRAGTSI